MIEGFTATAIGESHKEKGLPLQDAVFGKKYHTGYTIAVADGHGGEIHFRSADGSRLAVETACSKIIEFKQLFTGKKNFEEKIKQLERSIILHWRQAALEHYKNNPLREAEKECCRKLAVDERDENNQTRFYGTTLLAAWLSKSFWFVIQIGVGKCVIINEYKKAYFPPPLMEDETLCFGRTYSLCDSNAYEHFRQICGFSPPKGIILATDGVTDLFLPDAYLEFHEQFYADFCKDSKKAATDIKQAMSVWSAKGSRDDVSMAGMFIIEES